MNILFFLTPKSQVEYVLEDYSIRQTAEKLSFHHYSAIPILSKDGHYIGTVSDGDLFWYIKDHSDMNFKSAEKIPIRSVINHHAVKAIKSDVDMKDVMKLALNQNFVPVLDDRDLFIGIITRKAILSYFLTQSDKA